MTIRELGAVSFVAGILYGCSGAAIAAEWIGIVAVVYGVTWFSHC